VNGYGELAGEFDEMGRVLYLTDLTVFGFDLICISNLLVLLKVVAECPLKLLELLTHIFDLLI